MKHKYKIIILVVITLLFLTNPSVNQFKQFYSVKHSMSDCDYARTSYFGIASVYEAAYNGKTHGKYLGVAGNFVLMDDYTDEIRREAAIRDSLEELNNFEEAPLTMDTAAFPM